MDSMFGDAGAGVPDRTMPTTTREGYTFGGWFRDADLTDGPVTELDATYPMTDAEYWAAWTANTYPVVFDLNNADMVGTIEGADAWTDASFDVTFDGELPELEVDGVAMAAPKSKGYAFTGWYATGTDKNGETVEVPWYRAKYEEDGSTTWTKAVDGAWNDISVVSGEGADAQVVLKAKWVVTILGSAPAEIEFTIDPTTLTAQTESGLLRSYTPAPMTISQVQVEQRQQGFGQLFGQVDVDVKLNMTAEAGGSSLIVGVPTQRHRVARPEPDDEALSCPPGTVAPSLPQAERELHAGAWTERQRQPGA